MFRAKTFTLTGTSPASVGKSVIATQAGLTRFSAFRIDASLIGATGGTLDIELQRQIPGTALWAEWCRFTQLAAAGAAVVYSLYASQDQPNVTISTVGLWSTDLTVGALTLGPAPLFTGGHPGDEVRVIAIAGAGTSAGAVTTVYLTAFELYT